MRRVWGMLECWKGLRGLMLCGFRGFFILLGCFRCGGVTNRAVYMIFFFIICASTNWDMLHLHKTLNPKH